MVQIYLDTASRITILSHSRSTSVCILVYRCFTTIIIPFFVVGFLVWQFPTMFISQKTRLGKYLGCNIVLWGIVLMLHAIPNTFGPFFALRILLGKLKLVVMSFFRYGFANRHVRELRCSNFNPYHHDVLPQGRARKEDIVVLRHGKFKIVNTRRGMLIDITERSDIHIRRFRSICQARFTMQTPLLRLISSIGHLL